MRAVTDRLAAGNLRPLAAGLAVYYAILAVAHSQVLQGRAAVLMTALAAGTVVLLAAVFLMSRSKAVVDRAHLTTVFMGALAMANSLAHLAVTAEPKQTTNVAIVMIAGGLILYSRLWLAITLSASFVSWLWIADSWPPEADWTHNLFMVFSACVVAALTLMVRMRAIENLEGMKLAVRQAELDAKLQRLHKVESLGLMAGGVAHDLNNVLVGVLGNADLAKRSLPADSPAQTYLHELEDAGRRASALAGQMLAFSGKGRFVSEPLSLRAIVRDAERLVRASISKNVKLDITIAPDVPPVEGDATQIQQVIFNLVLNAAEASGDKPGQIYFQVDRFETQEPLKERAAQGGEAPPGVYARMTVRDQGGGMEEATLERMFDPFYTTKQAGRGLGLATASGIVRAHGGVIQVESRPGEGATVAVLLPQGSRVPEAPLKRLRPSQAKLPKGATVLVADDELAVRWVVRETLRNAGIRVLEAKNGLEALQQIRNPTHSIDLALLDLTMPLMTGQQVMKETADLPIRVVLMSGYSDRLVREAAGPSVPFLHKPFTAEELLQQVEAAIGR